MCFELDAHPPGLPLPMAGGAADGRALLLEAADGNRFPAYAALPSGAAPGAAFPAGSGMVVIPDIRGLVPYYEELALRFAEAGLRAVSIDLYARTAGTASRTADFDYRTHARRTSQAGVAADVAAAVRFLRSEEMGADGGANARRRGFCLGRKFPD